MLSLYRRRDRAMLELTRCKFLDQLHSCIICLFEVSNMPRRFGYLAFCVVTSILLTTVSSSAKVIHIPADQPTIQAGIDAASNGDTVVVAAGTYYENINFNGKAITVKSSSGAKVTIIDGGGVAPVVTFDTNEPASSMVNGFTLQNGISTVGSLYMGGGVFVYFASPTLKNNIIENNHACNGGGIGVYYGSPAILSNTVAGNSQSSCYGGSGAIAVVGDGSAQIVGNIISNNTSPIGDCGGISLVGAGSPTILNNIITGNVASGLTTTVGGGICIQNVSGANALIAQNLIYANTADLGAGIYAFVPSGSQPVFVNNTVVGSSASLQGSAVYITGYDDQAQFFNNLLIGGSQTNAVYCDNQYDQIAPTFTNNDAYSANGTGLQGACSGESSTNGNISANPSFVNTYHLRGGSPAIDVGTNSAPNLPIRDLAGNPRIINGNDGPTAIVDMGASEFVPVVLSPTTLKFGVQAVGSSTSKTVTLANKQGKALNISSITTSTSYSASGCGTSLAAFKSCILTVTFNPQTAGTFNGSLIVADDAGNSPQAVSLLGKAQ